MWNVAGGRGSRLSASSWRSMAANISMTDILSQELVSWGGTPAPSLVNLAPRRRVGRRSARRERGGMDMLEAGGQRVVIEGVEPEVDCGRFAIKRTVGERVVVEADAFTDGHDALICRLLWRPESRKEWSETAMEALPNDRWRAELTPTEQGRWLYTVTGWVDRFKTWRRDLKKRVEAGQDVSI